MARARFDDIDVFSLGPIDVFAGQHDQARDGRWVLLANILEVVQVARALVILHGARNGRRNDLLPTQSQATFDDEGDRDDRSDDQSDIKNNIHADLLYA